MFEEVQVLDVARAVFVLHAELAVKQSKTKIFQCFQWLQFLMIVAVEVALEIINVKAFQTF